MTCVLIRKGEETQRDSRMMPMTTEAEIEVMHPQAKVRSNTVKLRERMKQTVPWILLPTN